MSSRRVICRATNILNFLLNPIPITISLRTIYAATLGFRSRFFIRRLVTVFLSIIVYGAFAHNKLRLTITPTNTRDEAVFPLASFGSAKGKMASPWLRTRRSRGVQQDLSRWQAPSGTNR
jgi:hypothetical protein